MEKEFAITFVKDSVVYYRCPKCQHVGKVNTKGATLVCTKCGQVLEV